MTTPMPKPGPTRLHELRNPQYLLIHLALMAWLVFLLYLVFFQNPRSWGFAGYAAFAFGLVIPIYSFDKWRAKYHWLRDQEAAERRRKRLAEYG